MHDNIEDHELQERVIDDEDGATKAQKMVEEAETGSRSPDRGWQAWLIPVIAASWSIFQLLLAEAFIIQADITRAIHLAFAIVLVYLSYPFLKSEPFPKAGSGSATSHAFTCWISSWPYWPPVAPSTSPCSTRTWPTAPGSTSPKIWSWAPSWWSFYWRRPGGPWPGPDLRGLGLYHVLFFRPLHAGPDRL